MQLKWAILRHINKLLEHVDLQVISTRRLQVLQLIEAEQPYLLRDKAKQKGQ